MRQRHDVPCLRKRACRQGAGAALEKWAAHTSLAKFQKMGGSPVDKRTRIGDEREARRGEWRHQTARVRHEKVVESVLEAMRRAERQVQQPPAVGISERHAGEVRVDGVRKTGEAIDILEQIAARCDRR